MPELTCTHCEKKYHKVPSLAKASRFCSRSCQRDYHGWSSNPNTSCGGCGKAFHVKPSKLSKMTHKPCCSRECLALYRSGVYAGTKNPNYRGRTENHDGYRLTPPYANGFSDVNESLLHKAVAARALGVKKIKGFHVHHRDCDVLNNQAGNLAVLNSRDRKWIHKQFGNATLWAAMRGKIDFSVISSWSDDSDRAFRILNCCIENQDPSVLGSIEDGVLSPRS